MRRDVALVVAALALLASVVTGREKPTAEIIEEKRPAKVQVEDIDVSRLQRPETPLAAADPFAQRSFTASAEKSVPRENAKPSAPPLPFKYLGKAIEDGKLEVFLAMGEESYSVRAGQKIGADYRVDKVSEAAITFTYLPLKTQQTLEVNP
jgi:Tfp pilus assembly protein PilP